MESFNKFSRKCTKHYQNEKTKKCYCGITRENCNLFNCPKMNGGKEKKWKETDVRSAGQFTIRKKRIVQNADRKRKRR